MLSSRCPSVPEPRRWLPSRILALALLAGCGDPPADPASASSHAGAADLRLHLAPPADRHALVGEPYRLALVRGATLGGAALASIDERFDPFVARLGGAQEIVAPDLRDGRAGVTLRFQTAGNALVGFSTLPRLVELGGRAIACRQHVKTILPVTHGPGDVPRASASVSHRIGLTLELVPMIDPLGLLAGDELPLRVRFDGPALAGATVRLLHRPSGARDDAEPELVEAISDPVGTVVLPIGGPGAYLVTTEHRIDREDAPPELHQAALTFTTGGDR